MTMMMNKEKLKLLRAQTKMSMKQFAEYFGIPYRTVQNWENNTRSCPEYLMRLMEYKLIKEGLIEAKIE
jgi:DNA-binding transcriptional regulator YiaG